MNGAAKIGAGAFAVGAAGLLFCLVGPWAGSARFYSSYLFAYLFWIGLSLGCLAVMMLHPLVGGEWGVLTRRLLHAGARTLPIMTLLSLPILLGLSSLYPWAGSDPPAMAESTRTYLNRPFFLARAAFYFATWLTLACLVSRWSARLEATPDPRLSHRLRLLCAWGLVAYGLTVFFSSVDWMMSLEPGWPSTVYGMIVMAGQALSALAGVTALAGALGRTSATPARMHDLGNLLLAFVMLWAYVSFSQYLVIWFGDLPRETPWYLVRSRGGWEGVAVALILLHFAVPFVLLLFRRIKRSPVLLPIIAGGLVAVHALEVFWRVRPPAEPAGFALHGSDLVAPIAVGGFWIGGYAFLLGRRPLPPPGEARHA